MTRARLQELAAEASRMAINAATENSGYGNSRTAATAGPLAAMLLTELIKLERA